MVSGCSVLPINPYPQTLELYNSESYPYDVDNFVVGDVVLFKCLIPNFSFVPFKCNDIGNWSYPEDFDCKAQPPIDGGSIFGMCCLIFTTFLTLIFIILSYTMGKAIITEDEFNIDEIGNIGGSDNSLNSTIPNIDEVLTNEKSGAEYQKNMVTPVEITRNGFPNLSESSKDHHSENGADKAIQDID